MTTRSRRLLSGLAILVVLLYVGRWSVGMLAERWWATSIGAPVVDVVERWRLLGLALDVAAIVGASCWFTLQALLVARTVATVAVTRQVGDLQLREAVPARLLWFAGIGTGVLLGLITGAGARAWRGPVALAWQAVQYGVVDPLLGEDLGLYATQLPVWDLAHDFALTLALLGLMVTTMLYVGIGGIRRERGGLVVHPDARHHIGWLLAAFSLVVAVGYLLEPYHLAVQAGVGTGAMAFLTQVRAAQAMAGVAGAVGILSVIWSRRGRHALLVGGWGALLLGALIEAVVIPSLAAESSPPAVGAAELRQLESLAWGIRYLPATPATDTIPSPTALWDESILSSWFAADGRVLLGATPGTLPTPGGPVAGWLVAATSTADDRRVDVLGVVEGVVGETGGPFLVRPGGASDTVSPLFSLADPRIRPDGEGWRTVLTGVVPGGPLRRATLAWARQGWGLLTSGSARAVDWHLDPTERAAAVLPMVSWSSAVPTLIGGRLLWVVQGVLTAPLAPLASHGLWRGTQVAGVVPAFVASIDAVSGAVIVYLDPGADSLAAGWNRFAKGLALPAAQIPAALRASLVYPAPWLTAQLAVLEAPEWGLGRRPGRLAADGLPETPLVVWESPQRPGRVAVFEDPARRVVSAVVVASRVDGVPVLQITRLDRSPIANARELERDWDRDPTLAHLRDSAHAAGDTVHIPAVRWRIGAGEPLAWQPLFTVPAKGHPALLGVGGAVGDRLAAGRTPAEVWGKLLQGASGAMATGPSEASRLALAQEWLRRADSALARHDLTAFGRAFEELRKVLEGPPR
ncbi:MAG: UPF0182 family protein [Gemmatimonadota bacterium]